MNFIEKGYARVLDADISTGENSRGKYNVFVELERNRRLPSISCIWMMLQNLRALKNGNIDYKDVESKPLQKNLFLLIGSYNTFIQTFQTR